MATSKFKSVAACAITSALVALGAAAAPQANAQPAQVAPQLPGAGWTGPPNPFPQTTVYEVTIDPSDYVCDPANNGVQHEFATSMITWNTDAFTTAYLVFTCENGVLTVTTKVCNWGMVYNSCAPIPPIDPNGLDPIQFQMRVVGPSVTLTLTDLTTMKSVTRSTKAKASYAVAVGSGVTNFSPKGKAMPVEPFSTIGFKDISLNGLPLAASQPSGSSLLDKQGRVVAAPSELGSDGASFTVSYT